MAQMNTLEEAAPAAQTRDHDDMWTAFLARKKLEDDQWFAALKEEAQKRAGTYYNAGENILG